jgi:hypothetical protein
MPFVNQFRAARMPQLMYGVAGLDEERDRELLALPMATRMRRVGVRLNWPIR